MKRAIVLFALLLACDSGATADAGPDGSGVAACDGGCATSLDLYCQSNPSACPQSASEAIANFCASGGGIKVYGNCGDTIVIRAGKDTSDMDVFGPDGALVAIYGGTCCTAGPAGFDAPSIQGCTLAQPSCDAGASDAAAE